MQGRTCTACGRTVAEADRRWDEARSGDLCPFCGVTPWRTTIAFEGPEAPNYRNFWRRLLGAGVDLLLFMPLVVLHFWMFPRIAAAPARVLWYVSLAFSFEAYSILCHWRWGQTVGKRLFCVVVRDLNGAPLSFRQAVLRDIVPLVAVAIDVGLDPCGGARPRSRKCRGFTERHARRGYVGLLARGRDRDDAPQRKAAGNSRLHCGLCRGAKDGVHHLSCAVSGAPG